MPQGAKNSGTFFAQIAADTFAGIPKSDLINYVDDTTNHSRRFYKHYLTQQAMYDALRKKRLIGKLSKCHFLYPTAKVLGHILSEFGRTPSSGHVQAIIEMAPPRSQTEVRAFLGLLNFNREYLSNYKNYVAILDDLLRLGVNVEEAWTEEHEASYRSAKLALSNAPCLMTIDVTKPFCLHVDACRIGRGLGAVLLQKNERGHWRPVSYYSYKLKDGERTRCATELEAMGLVYAIRHWARYLRVQEFAAIVDHHALLYLVTQPSKTSNVRLLNWISELHNYRFNIYYRPGKKHLDADAVSRLLRYEDLEQHDAMDTEDESALTDSGPVTSRDIALVHRHIDMYREELADALRNKGGEQNRFSETLLDRLTVLKRMMGSTADKDFWKLMTDGDFVSMQPELPLSESELEFEDTSTIMDSQKKVSRPPNTDESYVLEMENSARNAEAWNRRQVQLASPNRLSEMEPIDDDGSIETQYPMYDTDDEDNPERMSKNEDCENDEESQGGSLKEAIDSRIGQTEVSSSPPSYVAQKRRQDQERRAARMKEKLDLPPRVTRSSSKKSNEKFGHGAFSLVAKPPDTEQIETGKRPTAIVVLRDANVIHESDTKDDGYEDQEIAEFLQRVQNESYQDEEEERRRIITNKKRANEVIQQYKEYRRGLDQKEGPFLIIDQRSPETSTRNPFLRLNSEGQEQVSGQEAIYSHTNTMIPGKSPHIRMGVQRENVPPPPPLRNEFMGPWVPSPLDVPPDSMRQYKLDTLHPLAQQHQGLLNQVFKDTATHRMYEVIVVYFDHDLQEVAVYRHALDDLPPHPYDKRPWSIESITEMIERYQRLHPGAPHKREIKYKWPESEEEMLSIQRQDPLLQPIIASLEGHENWPEWVFQVTRKRCVYLAKDREGKKSALRVYRNQEDLNDESMHHRDPHVDQIVLPGMLASQLIEFYHDHQAHPGTDRTLRTILNRYWWESVRTDVKMYCDSCQFCRFQKNHHHNVTPTIQLYAAPSHPFEEIHIDLTEVSESRRKNWLILVVKCALTAAIELVALPGKEAECVARAMVDRVYLRHGSPRIIYSDQGKEFCNKVMQQISAIFQLRQIRTTPGNPRSNGLVENHNKTLKDQLAVFTNARQDDWDDFLPVVQYAYMTTVSSRTGYTPFFMLHGREARQPSDIWISAFRNISHLSTYVKELVETLHQSWIEEGRNKPRQVEVMNKVHVPNTDFSEFEVGDRFFLRRTPTPSFKFYDNPNRKAKDAIKPNLQRRFTGPYVVSRKFSPVLYEAKIDGKYQSVHALKMQRDPLSPQFRQHIQHNTPPILMERSGYEAQIDRHGLPLLKEWGYHRRVEGLEAPSVSTSNEEPHREQGEEDDD